MAKYDEALAELSTTFWDDYQQYTAPLQSEMIDAYQNYSTVDQATQDAIKARTILGQVADRAQSRSGATLTNAAGADQSKRKALGDALTAVNASNTATMQDIDTRDGMLTSLLQQGGQLRQNALGGLGQVSGIEANRIAANNAMQAQARGSAMGLLGSAAGIGMALAL